MPKPWKTKHRSKCLKASKPSVPFPTTYNPLPRSQSGIALNYNVLSEVAWYSQLWNSGSLHSHQLRNIPWFLNFWTTSLLGWSANTIPKDPDGSSIASQILSKLHCGDEAFPFKVQMGILAARSPWIVTGSTWYAWGSRNCIEAPCLFFFVGIYWHSNIRVSRAFFVAPSFVFLAIHASQINQSCNTSQA